MDLRAPNTTWSGKMFEHFVPSRPYLPPVNDQLTGLKEAGEHHIIAEVRQKKPTSTSFWTISHGISSSMTHPHAPADVPCYVPMLIGW